MQEGVIVYKADDGTQRWASVSNVAIKDKELEIVTEQAYDDAIEYAQKSLDFGEIDLVHVEGTDVGKCDLMLRAGNRLIEGGTFDDTDLARGAIKALEADPDHWGVSIKFVYDPSNFDGEKYNGNIRIPKRTILPQEMAASHGTKLVAIGGPNAMEKQQVSERAREALEKLNVPQEEIEALAEKQVEAEPNTVEKEAEETPEAEKETVEAQPEPEVVEVEKSLWDRLKSAFSKPEAEEAVEPDAETGGAETLEVEPVEAQEKETQEVDLAAEFKGLLDVYTEATIEAVGITMKEQREQITVLGEAVLMLSEQIKALQGPIEDKIEKRLAELPKIAKAAPSMTAVIEQPAPGRRTLPYPNSIATSDYVGELMKSVQDEVEQKTAHTGRVDV
jgi:hypothetical protein